ncbi:UDP-N-acetylmuramoyl-L-alanine--D-glutamate ligase [Indioceanicola profundi]|uniref:UDP-N-acetylmuramoyl-L-alanine--D-glutamate ligase n=1 Tax=Indioceanicola profundi TaxID=2220096 RepID=UPI000E6AE279|nr:UDP-N-acetylmuramoyl-L-alanine--D-glutamate ligase [Indioceanicola profundi]
MIDLSHLKGQKIAVMGLAKSGLASARALLAGGAEVLAWDDGEAGRTAATGAGIQLTDLHKADLAGVAALVLSPGIPHTFPKPNPVAQRAKDAGIPIIGDVELLRRACPDATYLGITGTNGKSTTTALAGHILAHAGRRIQVGGNLGTPVLTFEPLGRGDIYVLEMSSYQLELTPSLGFDAACLLNITPDHLDRHGGMDGYIAAKRLAFRGGASSPTAIIGIDTAPTAAMADSLEAEGGRKVVRISVEDFVPGGISAPDGVMLDDTSGEAVRVIDMAECPALPGRHNWQNACAAYALTRAAGVEAGVIAEAMRSFPGLAHRQQFVAEAAGVRFVNDSKATNADAAEKALGCYEAIYWILGGKPKEGGLDGLERHMRRIRHAFLIGEASDQFADWLAANNVPHTRCGTMETAVPTAFQAARGDSIPGAVVLLSPACASFDQYPNFEVRGDHFAKLATTLAAAAEEA